MTKGSDGEAAKRRTRFKEGSIADQARRYVHAHGVAELGDICRASTAATLNQVSVAVREETKAGRLVRLYQGVYATPFVAERVRLLVEAIRGKPEIRVGDTFLVNGVVMEIVADAGTFYFLRGDGDGDQVPMTAEEVYACERVRAL
jgi:hypothetical protein